MPFQHPFRNLLLSRQQLGEMLGLPDDMLAYWIREGLLLAKEGGSGRGHHRRFSYEQLLIAVVLKEIKRYGVAAQDLKSLSSILQNTIELVQSHDGLTIEDLYSAKNYIQAREYYLKLTSSDVADDPRWAFHLEDNFEQWIENRRHGRQSLHQTLTERGLAFVDHFSDEILETFEIYTDLFTDAPFKRPTIWMLSVSKETHWKIIRFDGTNLHEIASTAPSYIVVNVGLIIKRLSGDK